MTWKRRPPECTGDYTFSGQLFISREVLTTVPLEEIRAIVDELRDHIARFGPVDYLQVWENSETDQAIYWIDQISETMKEDGSYTPAQIREYDYSTILFSHEY